MTPLQIIHNLVQRFEEQSDAYKSGQYNEAQLRQEFIDPMFKALGWDMENISGYAEAYKDVIHEDAIKIGGATKAPDYCFRIGGTRKFFLEAKKPSVDIKHDASPAYQLRRYAWSAKLPLSILTDFEEFAVYDCRIEPRVDDKASVGRVLYLNFHDYVSKWEDIAKIFARDAILKGSFDKFAESTKAKRGTAEVDDAFLDEIEKWRADLARNLAMRNPKLSQRDLNFSVQRTIDRIVFLRICEDRRIEHYGRLQILLNGENTYRRLNQLYREADDRYNSGLFHFQKEKDRIEPPDDLTPHLEIDDVVLKKIIRRLYYPDSPYEFSVLPADILGQVYEQFLGKVIRLTEGHQAKVEDKPEVKKAGGVYYTPTYIVDYIVKNTVGKLLENKTPKQASSLRIVDPACGSGSFLIGAYQYLLDWHRDWYVAHDPKKHATGRNPVLYQGIGGEWKLTTAERKRILLQNIYGVDIDAQAVETTKLSLLLKVLEGESEQTLATQLRIFHERALPDLGRNIKCGNSLIGSDFYEQSGMLFLGEEERYRINVFDWNAEFPEIMNAGGFDAVIGNPPYLSYYSKQSEGDKQLGALVNYWKVAYKFIRDKSKLGRFNSVMFFLEKTLDLLNPSGIAHLIIDTSFYSNPFIDIRSHLLANCAIFEIVTDFNAFKKVGSSQVMLQFQASKKSKNILWKTIKDNSFIIIGSAPQSEYRVGNFELFPPREESAKKLLKTIGSWPAFETIVGRKQIRTCITFTGQKDAFVIVKKTKPSHYPLLEGSHGVARPYGEPAYFQFVNYDLSLRDELNKQYRQLAAKEGKRTPMVIGLGDLQAFKAPKLFLRLSADRLTATYCDDLLCADLSLYVITLPNKKNRWEGYQLKYFLGLINSAILTYHARTKGIIRNLNTGTPQIRLKDVRALPIRTINFSDDADRSRHNEIVKLVDRMLELNKQLLVAQTAHHKTSIQRQINATDAQIDQLVYELYDLSDDEIKIVKSVL